MKITRIEPVLVGAPTPGVGLLSNRNYLFIKVHTDEGITGLGEATLESHDNSVLGALKDIECLVLGEDPTKIEYLTQKMVKQLFWKGGVIKGSAISGKVWISRCINSSAEPAARRSGRTSTVGAAALSIPQW